jgi:hypothetical protein
VPWPVLHLLALILNGAVLDTFFATVDDHHLRQHPEAVYDAIIDRLTSCVASDLEQLRRGSRMHSWDTYTRGWAVTRHAILAVLSAQASNSEEGRRADEQVRTIDKSLQATASSSRAPEAGRGQGLETGVVGGWVGRRGRGGREAARRYREQGHGTRIERRREDRGTRRWRRNGGCEEWRGVWGGGGARGGVGRRGRCYSNHHSGTTTAQPLQSAVPLQSGL